MGKRVFLDLSGGRINGRILEVGRNSSRVVESFSVNLGDPFPAAASGEIEESYLSLPLDMLDFRVMELPFADIKKIREVLPLELDNVILDGSSGVVFDARILGRGKTGTRVLVVYIGKGKLSGILEKLKPLGMDPRVVTSLELLSVLESASSEEDLTGLLASPPALDEPERANLAVREAVSQTINLRSGDLAYTADTEKAGKSLRWTLLLAGLLFAVFISDMGFRIITAKKEISTIRDGMRKTYSGLFPQDKKVSDELYQLKAHLKELKDKENAYVGVAPLRVLLDLVRVNVPGVSFTEITIDKERLILKGECNSLGDVQVVKGKLEGVLTDVSITDAKPGPKGRTVFAVAAKGRKAQ